MSLDLHTVSLIPGTQPVRKDALRVGFFPDVPTVAGGAAGAAVVLTVNAALLPGLALPPKYNVHVQPNQDAVANVTAKTSAGFTVTLLPRLAASILAIGTVDIFIVAA